MSDEKHPPGVLIQARGHLLRVRSFGSMPDDFPLIARKRARVEGFSAASRVRLLRLLATIKAPDSDGYRGKVSFLTLTSKAMLHPRLFKKHLFNMLRELSKEFPSMAVVWRLEYQKRGAPHAHCILYNAPYINMEKIQSMWAYWVGEERPFTRIERIKSYRQVMSYASKYVAKLEADGACFNYLSNLYHEEGLTDEEKSSPGRVWGVWNRGALPLDVLEESTIGLDGSWWLVRRFVTRGFNWLEETSPWSGFTLFCDNPYAAKRYIESLYKQFVLAEERAPVP
jgi:hypothetical protein